MNTVGPGAELDAEGQLVCRGVQFGLAEPFIQFLGLFRLFGRLIFHGVDFLLQRLHLLLHVIHLTTPRACAGKWMT